MRAAHGFNRNVLFYFWIALAHKQGCMCGIGLLADVHGRRSHETIERGLHALGRLTHRGAPSDTASIDGAGVLTEIPWALLAEEMPGALAGDGTPMVGAFLIPGGKAAAACPLIERELRRAGWPSVVWRPVPAGSNALDHTLRA